MTHNQKGLCAFFILGSLSYTPSLAQSSDNNQYFRGKTITILVPSAPGGGRSSNVAPVVERLSRNIPGNPIIIAKYMPGAGGSLAINHLYNVALRDGTFLASPLTGTLISQITKDTSVQYDISKMNWIGRTTDNAEIIYTWNDTNVFTINDAIKNEILIGTSSLSSIHSIIPIVLNDVLGTKFKIIQGYTSSAAINLAVERREVDGAATTWENIKTNHIEWVRSNKINILAQVAAAGNPDLPNVPVMIDFAKNDPDRELINLIGSASDMGQSFIAPPNIPNNVLNILRRAFDKTVKDQEYIDMIEKMGIKLNPMTGEQLTEISDKVLNSKPETITRFQSIIAKYQ